MKAAPAVVVLLLGLVESSKGSPPKPHVVLVLADDYGWNDVGYHQDKVSSANPEGKVTTNGVIQTPTIDRLCSEGVKLENYYVQPLCSPTRGTVMTGRYPSHTGVGPTVILPDMPYAMSKDEVFLPQLMKENGYATHMVGKWHLGFCDERYTPTYRGFDSYLGYLLGAEDYFNHSRVYQSFSAFDFRNGSTTDALAPLLKTEQGRYSTHIFAEEVERLIKNHDESTPFFLYLPFQAVHAPLQVPEEYSAPYNGTIPHTTATGGKRLVMAGMVSALDEAVNNVTKALQEKGMWDDTVLIFSTDNGGPTPQGNNYPLRGHKNTNWEGGVRGNAFVRGTNSDLAPLPKGVTNMHLMHSSDWLPTVVSGIVGGSTSSCQPLDGHDQWDVMKGEKETTRKSVIHNMPAAGQGLTGGAVRLGRHKLLVLGQQTTANTPQTPPPEMPQPSGDVIPKPFQYNGTSVWVFDVLSDPTESHNLASNATLLQKMIEFYSEYQKTAVPDLNLLHKEDPLANPQHLPDQAWGPWASLNGSKCVYV